MEKRIRQSVGIDCSKDHLDCSFGIMHASFDEVILSNSKFTNNAAGLKKLLLWSKTNEYRLRGGVFNGGYRCLS